MATIKYFTRSITKGKWVKIRIRFIDGKDIDLFADSGLQVKNEHWSNKTQTVKNIAEATYKDDLNTTLRELKNTILREQPKGESATKEWLTTTIDKFHHPEKYETKQVTLFSFIGEFIDKAPTRITPKTGQPVCYKMIREYERTFHYLKEFAKDKKRKISFNHIDLDFYHDFITYLQNLNLAKNTIGKKIQTLKIFLNAATDAGANTNMAFKSPRFTTLSEESDNIYLNEEELNKMYKLDLSNAPRLERARDLFIVGCWTGLRYGDWQKVNSKSIEDGFIEVKQSKTGNPVTIPVHPNVFAILNKYDGVLPRMISDQKLRDYLKEVGQMAGIDQEVEKTITRGGILRTTKYKKWQMIGTHTARRSFATNMYKRGIPTITIMAITGHKTETSFLKYIKITPREHAEKMREMWNRQSMRVVNE